MEPKAIAMITDFFHPNVGGVESHVYMLSANLIKHGHKVIVITHSHPPNRVGIHWLLPSLKVYYLPFVPIASSAMLPNFFPTSGRFSFGSTFTSSLRVPVYPLSATKEFCFLIYLFGFEDAASILTNKLLAGTLRNVDAVICVSHTGVRDKVYVIPNALVPEHFQPGTLKTSDIVTIVVLSRFAYRKSIDLLVVTAPRICNAFPNVCFVVVIDLPQMREKHNLQDGIELLRPIRPNVVRSIFMRGAIFLDTSFTDPLVSPSSRRLAQGCIFAEPEEDDVSRAVSEAIEMISDGKRDPIHAHERVKTFYDWVQVAERAEVVYDTVVKSRQMELWERMKRFVRSSRSMVGIC
ncbi:UDP-Glycosyltransferase/glycogen phosphorylase [Armillaria gallica]|uniref:UDP-Glycosyltransferase/glycogen phosphorylase n=1 Tax=Armillaria gallica TaxID=47427 RepID=A0A2H3EEM5_ARMGA|nr:UDP-Glycosyltransferase/glycogen phosphorylase [Armillaria gallica]